VPFVDLVRAAAVLFMIQGHALNVLLAPQYAGGPFFHTWVYLRGLTSCTFLMLSGFSFSLATIRRWPEYRVPGRRVYRRMARYLMLLVLGYCMRFPSRSLSGLSTISPDQWQSFAIVDVLQLVAVTLTALQVAVWLLESPRAFMTWSLGAAAVTVLVAPVVSHLGWGATAPIFLRAYLTSATGSLFPALPWSPYGAIEFWTVSPNLFLAKAGSVLIGLAATIWLARGARALPRVVTALSRESLLVYLAHVVLLYGSAWTVGFSQSVGARLGPGPVLVWIAALLAAMSLLAWTWHECKRHLSNATRFVRAIAVCPASLTAPGPQPQGSERFFSIQDL
jgi:hypothetical protein